MPKLIYAEPDDEITNLVDRLRSEKEERDLVFVLPASSRVMQSNLNARLLMQYSNSLGKRTSVVSPDPRTQSTALETGFSVFPSLAAFEAGGALDQAMAGAAAAAPSLMAPVPAGAAVAERVRRPTAPAARPAARPVPVRTPATAVTVGRGVGAAPYLLGAIGVAIIGLILLLVVLPAATIEIITPARDVAVTPVLNGSPAGPNNSDQLGVQTAIQQAQENAKQQFPATGQKTIPGNQAQGMVVFSNHCVFCTSVKFPVGTQVYTDDNIKFVTTAEADVGSGTDSPPVPIVARSGGVNGNVPAGAIKHVTTAPDQPLPPNVTVNNPQPTSGGTDPTQKQVVSQQDLDHAKSALGDPLVPKVKDELNQKAGSQKVLPDTVVVSTDANYDKKVGDEAQNFNADVTVKGHATSVDDGKVKQVLLNALRKKVPADYTLTSDKPVLDYKLTQHDDSGNVVFEGKAAGFMTPAIDRKTFQRDLAGKSEKEVRTYISTHVDAVDVHIRHNPSFIPWMPFISSKIDIREQVQNTQPSPA